MLEVVEQTCKPFATGGQWILRTDLFQPEEERLEVSENGRHWINVYFNMWYEESFTASCFEKVEVVQISSSAIKFLDCRECSISS